MDKELVGRSQPEGSGQWLSVKMETDDEWCPAEVHIGTSTL